MTMNRNVITLIVAVLAIATVVLGYQLYQERHKKSGIDISIGGNGISIDKK
jgi:predicted negative regulator of RcsB-dependent stress response